eukprot:12418811-Alexandrium_andersonii.AAC.1
MNALNRSLSTNCRQKPVVHTKCTCMGDRGLPKQHTKAQWEGLAARHARQVRGASPRWRGTHDARGCAAAHPCAEKTTRP